jgi:hypothetical protein
MLAGVSVELPLGARHARLYLEIVRMLFNSMHYFLSCIAMMRREVLVQELTLQRLLHI